MIITFDIDIHLSSIKSGCKLCLRMVCYFVLHTTCCLFKLIFNYSNLYTGFSQPRIFANCTTTDIEENEGIVDFEVC